MNIIPQPKMVRHLNGNFWLDVHKKIIVAAGSSLEFMDIAMLLNEEIEENLGYCCGITKVSLHALDASEGIILRQSDELGSQQYTIDITPDRILLTGGTVVAVRYAVQTLRQLIRYSGAVIPCQAIEDYPDIKNRGYFADVTRGRIPTLESLKKLADRLSFYKYNQLQLYIEHTYMYEEFSEMWRDDTPLSAEEILILDEYCAKRGIELIPCMASFGHLYKLLRTKSFMELCELENSDKEEFSFVERMRHHTIDCSNPKSTELVKKMISEYMELFSSRYFNINGDEPFDMGKGRSSKLAEEIGNKRMYIDFIKSACEFLVENGRTPMFWGDIIVGFPEFYSELPEGTICLNWGYLPNQREYETKTLSDAGVIQYVCPGVCGWNQYMNLVRDSYDNIGIMAHYAAKYKALGMLVTDWGDYGNINNPKLNIIGQIYGGAFSWNTADLSYEDINQCISFIEYGDQTGSFVSIVADIQKQCVFNWETAVKYMERIRYGKEEFADCIDSEKIENVDACADKLKLIKNALYEHIPSIKSSKRKDMIYYIHAIEAVEVWNAIGVIINDFDKGRTATDKKRILDTAAALEVYFMDFKKIWRSIGKEAELYRLQDVINWYADYIRDIAATD